MKIEPGRASLGSVLGSDQRVRWRNQARSQAMRTQGFSDEVEIKHMKLTSGSFALIVVAALSLQVFAHGNHDKKAHGKAQSQASKTAKVEFLGKGDGIETCPVTGDPVNKELKNEVNGRVFYVCCEGCADVVKKNPELFLKPVEGEKKEQAFLGKGDGVETCPVTGEPVDKNLKGEVDGQTFYVCCAGCIDTVKKNPAAYLKKAKAK